MYSALCKNSSLFLQFNIHCWAVLACKGLSGSSVELDDPRHPVSGEYVLKYWSHQKSNKDAYSVFADYYLYFTALHNLQDLLMCTQASSFWT